jgi:superfamily II DNA or RNA helicase
MMTLRPYQQEAVDAVLREWEGGVKRTLAVLPTGTGKTILFAKLLEEMVRRGSRALIIAHRGELLDQAADKIQMATGLGCSVEKADSYCLDEWFRITVGSVQTLMREKRLAQFPPDYFDVIIVDEAHHALADSYQRVLEHFGEANILGVTATPDRGDMRNLGSYFDSLAYEYTLPKAIRDGFLSPIKAQTIPLKLDLTGVGTQSGDFKLSDLDDKLAPYLEQIVQEMGGICQDRKTVVFLPLIRTSQAMRDLLADAGFDAREVNGESKDRAETLAWFNETGPGSALCNSMLLTEGWDCPSVDCVVCLRPTKIRSLYAQIIGRGTRLHPGKDRLLLLDFLWHSERHELCHPAHLIAEDDEVAKKMTQMVEESDNPLDIIDIEDEAEVEVCHEREEALAKQLAQMRERKRKLVDPLQFEMSIERGDLVNYKPTFGWESLEPTESQKKKLEDRGIFAGDVDSGKAQRLIDALSNRQSAGLTTPKQIRALERYGFQHVGGWKFEEANKLIGRIAANKWRVPYDIRPREYKPGS